MFQLRIMRLFVIFAIFTTTSNFIRANNNGDIIFNQEDYTFNNDDLYCDPELDDLNRAQDNDPIYKGGLTINSGDILDILTQLDPLSNISSPIWQKTAAPRGRDMLYHLPYKIATIEYGGAALSGFFNMTNKMHVTAQSLLDFEFLKSNDIDEIKSIIETFIPIPISDKEFFSLIPLFKKISIQERKSGALLQYGFIKGPWSIQLHSSLQLSERNFFLSNKDRRAIEAIFPGEKLNESEFFIIKVGAGDTRLKVGLNTLNTTNLKVDVGLETIFPTSRLSSQPTPQTFVFGDITTLQENGANFLRGIRDFILNPQLGNGGHFGLGNYLESKIDIFNNLASIRFRISYDKLFPNDAVRLFMFKKTRNKFADFAHVTSGPSKDELLTQLIQQFILPTPFKVHICPGSIFNAMVGLSTQTNHWEFALGYDFYAQQGERITEIFNTTVLLDELDVEGAQAAPSRQHKLFSEATYRKQCKKFEYGVGLGGDVTILSRGLGYDWTTYLKTFMSF